MTPDQFASIKQYVRFGEESAALLSRFHPIAEPHFHRIIGELFNNISDPDNDEIRFDDYVLTQN